MTANSIAFLQYVCKAVVLTCMPQGFSGRHCRWPLLSGCQKLPSWPYLFTFA